MRIKMTEDHTYKMANMPGVRKTLPKGGVFNVEDEIGQEVVTLGKGVDLNPPKVPSPEPLTDDGQEPDSSENGDEALTDDEPKSSDDESQKPDSSENGDEALTDESQESSDDESQEPDSSENGDEALTDESQESSDDESQEPDSSENGDEALTDEVQESSDDESQASTTDENDDEIILKIAAVIETLSPSDFTSKGVPKIIAFSDKLDFKPSKEQVLAAVELAKK